MATDLFINDIEPAFAISTHCLIEPKDWNVVTKRVKFRHINDVLDLMVETLEAVGYEKEAILGHMFNYSSIKVSGDVREEIMDMIKSIDEERDSIGAS